MMVYILTAGEYADAMIVGVFTSLSVARHHVQGLHGYIEELELDTLDLRGARYVPPTQVES